MPTICMGEVIEMAWVWGIFGVEGLDKRICWVFCGCDGDFSGSSYGL